MIIMKKSCISRDIVQAYYLNFSYYNTVEHGDISNIECIITKTTLYAVNSMRNGTQRDNGQ